MSVGDQSDLFKRIKMLLPRWFGDTTPILDAVIQGLAYSGSFIYSLYVYAKLQTRIKTATDGWLDLISADYFGTSLPRKTSQSDASYRARIIINLLRERATRNGITKVLIDLTGRAPTIFEPQRPLDTGAYGGPLIGYSLAGGYGSMSIPFQAFVQAYRPSSSGIPNVIGYGATLGGYGAASQFEYASLSQIQGAVTDADILAAIDSVKPAATIIWTRISS